MFKKARFKQLLEPGYIGTVRTRNRMLKSGASMAYAKDYLVTEKHKAFYEALARGGVGLIIVEHSDCDYPLGTVFLDGTTLRLDDDKFIPSLSELVQVIHKHGCPTFLQLMHSGPGNSSNVDGLQPVSSSLLTESEMPKISLPGWKYIPCRELTVAEIEEIIHKFALAAERAEKAGFDGVEISGATNHLINSFLSRIFNKRQDKYGIGSLENRARFLVEIIQVIKKRLGQAFPVSTLINGAEFGHPKGITIEEAKGFAGILEAAGADAIQVRACGYGEYYDSLQSPGPESVFYPQPPKPFPKELDGSRHGAGLMVTLAAAIKKVVSIPVITVGRLDPVLGEKILREGKADFIAMTRRLIADPELPQKVAAGTLDDIAPCTACLSCVDPLTPPTSCRINAAVGGDEEYVIRPAAKKKKVLVIGGGPSGMEAARVAAIRGHQVTLVEKQPVLGGLIPLAGMVKGLEIEDLEGLISYLKNQVKKLGVDIRVGKDYKPSLIDEIKPDAVILAVGGIATTPDVSGLGRKNVIILSHLDRMLRPFLRFFGIGLVRWATNFYMPGGKRIIVLGGTFYGCELAEFLVKRGRKVTIVDTETAEMSGKGMPLMRRSALLVWLNKKGVTIMTEVKYEEITNKGLVVTTKEGKRQTIEADTVMPSTLLIPNTELLKELKENTPEVYAIGDCREPRMIIDAISDGFRVANTI